MEKLDKDKAAEQVEMIEKVAKYVLDTNELTRGWQKRFATVLGHRGQTKLSNWLKGSPIGSSGKAEIQKAYLDKKDANRISEYDSKTDQEILDDITKEHRNFKQTVEQVINGAVRGLIVYSQAGRGKSFTTEQILNDNGYYTDLEINATKNTLRQKILFAVEQGDEKKAEALQKEINKPMKSYVLLKGATSPIGFYRCLFENPDKVIVVDDCDDLLGDGGKVGRQALNLLKSALEMTPRRLVSWHTTLSKKDYENGLRESFLFTGSIIFLTNLDIRDRGNSSSKIAGHFTAVTSRCRVIDLEPKTDKANLIWCHHMFYKHMSKALGLTKDQAVDIVDFIDMNKDKFKHISLRLYAMATEIYLIDRIDWKYTVLQQLTH